jgi:hypothetical protein
MAAFVIAAAETKAKSSPTTGRQKAAIPAKGMTAQTVHVGVSL